MLAMNKLPSLELRLDELNGPEQFPITLYGRITEDDTVDLWISAEGWPDSLVGAIRDWWADNGEAYLRKLLADEASYRTRDDLAFHANR